MTDPAKSAVAELPYAEDIVPTEKASTAVVVTMALAQFGLFVALLAPVTVSLALKVQSLVPKEQAAASLGTVLSVAAFVALFAPARRQPATHAPRVP